MRKPRQAAESGIYHVIARGAGRRTIFEDDADRHRYLNDLKCDNRVRAFCHILFLLNGKAPRSHRLERAVRLAP